MNQALSKGPDETLNPSPGLNHSYGRPEAVMRLRCCKRRLLPAGCGDGWQGRAELAVGVGLCSQQAVGPWRDPRGSSGGEKERVRGLH